MAIQNKETEGIPLGEASSGGEFSEKDSIREKELIFNTLKQIADAIVNTFPRAFEVVIHDLSQPQKSIKYIVGDVTKRKIGGPLTDLAIKLMHQEGKNINDRYNYRTTTSNGRSLKSSTSFIRNSNGDIVAGFCINLDITDFINISNILNDFTLTTNYNFNGSEKTETFALTIDETIQALFQQAIAKVGKQSAYMNTEEKIELVKELEANGLFQIKGGVDHVALVLGVTKYTIYNYLKKIHTEQKLSALIPPNTNETGGR